MSKSSSSLSFGPEWMRKSSGKSDHSESIVNKSPLPWSGVAAGSNTGPNSVKTSVHNGMVSFASAARTSKPLHSTSGGGIEGQKTLTKKFEQVSPSQSQDTVGQDPVDQSTEKSFHNPNGKKYTTQEMLEIWEDMKQHNMFRNGGGIPGGKSELYYSVIPNKPVNKDPPVKKFEEPGHDSTELKSEFGQTRSHDSIGSATEISSSSILNLNGVDTSSSGWSPFGNAGTPIVPATTMAATATTNLNTMTINDSFTSSLFPQKPANQGLFANVSTPPPGISPPSAQTPILISPENLNWYYKDPNNNEYGPFSGKMMHDWYMGNWLQENLLIRRAEETEYIVLRDFKVKLNNFHNPFMVSLPPVPPRPLHQQFSGMQLDANWSPWHHQQQQQQQQLQQQQQQQQHQPQHQSPAAQQQAFYSGTYNTNSIEEGLWTSHNHQSPVESHDNAIQPQLIANDEDERTEAIQKSPVATVSAISPPKRHVESIVEITNKVELEQPAEVSDVVEVNEVLEHLKENKELSQAVAPVENKLPALAPWAKKIQVEEKPLAPSLKEIQQLEATQRIKVRNSEPQPAPAIASSITSSPTTSKLVAPSLPSAVSWAKPSSPTGQPMKTLAQIQKEEEAAAKKRLLTQTAQSVPTAAGAKRYADIAAPPGTMLRAAQGAAVSAPTSNAQSSSNTPSSTGGAWTTVGPGGKKVTPAKPEPVPVRRASGVPAVPAKVVAPLPAQSQEFLQWCKSTLRGLNQGVNQTELLSMLVSLPATADSKEIIADIIYANSSTMDGRRFAEEFLKRRKVADQENNGNSWSDIIQRAASASKPAVNDGWNTSFKVVGKKKGRKTDQ